jgi:hypothetical protein
MCTVNVKYGPIENTFTTSCYDERDAKSLHDEAIKTVIQRAKDLQSAKT